MSFSFSSPNPSVSQSQFIAYEATELDTPTLVLDEPSSWRTTNNGATYVVITADQFYTQLQSFKTYRENQGEVVEVVKIADIYDEFNHGIKSAQAIKDFLTYAYQNWSPQPVYVLLVGDASTDPKQYRSRSYTDDLPTHYVHIPVWGQTGNDYWFGKVSGNDDYADLIIGRLPIRYNNELSVMQQKIETYEQTPPSGDWQSRVVLIADDGAGSEQIDQFRNNMDSLGQLAPSNTEVITIYGPGQTIPSVFNDGAFMVSYAGHGGEGNWGSWASNQGTSFFFGDDIDNSQNGFRLPFVTVATCASGYFHGHRGVDSMAERLLARGLERVKLLIWGAK